MYFRVKKENNNLLKNSLQLQAFIKLIINREENENNGEEIAYSKAKGSRERI